MEYKEGFIVCNNNTKEVIVRKQNEPRNYIFITEDDLHNVFYGYCKPRSTYLLMKEFNINFDLATDVCNYIPFVDKDYNNSKLSYLYKMKQFLIKENCFIKDELLLYRLKQYPITLLDFTTSKLNLDILNKLSEITEVTDERKKGIINKKLDVYEFKNVTDEARFICNEIRKLKDKDNNSNIYIYKVDDELKQELLRMKETYQIPFEFDNDTNVKITPIGNKFLSLLKVSSDFQDVFLKLSSYKDSKLYNVLVSLVDKYEISLENPSDTYEFLNSLLTSTPFDIYHYKNSISVSDLSSYSDDDFVFFPTCNLNVNPRIIKDESYLNDESLSLLGLPTSKEKNSECFNKDINVILNTKNIYISYRKEIDGVEAYRSNLLDKLDINTINNYKYEYNISRIEDMIMLGIKASIYHKYKIKDMDLEKYDISDLKYDTYTNEFKGIDLSLLKKFYENISLKLSYSSMKKYRLCPFSYYCDYILKVLDNEDNISNRIGSFSHKILEKSYSDSFDFDECFNDLLNDPKYCSNPKETFFYKLMIDILKPLIDFNKAHENEGMLNKQLRECHVSIDEGGFIFHGFIDKILYYVCNDDVYAAIIDYKTGSDKMELYNVEDGFNLQLPVYMYLLKHSNIEEFQNKNIHIIGVYLQKVNRILFKSDPKKSILDQKNNSFKLEGYTIDDVDLISLIDPNYDNSNYIKSLKTNKDGTFGQYSKIMSENQQNELIAIAISNINDTYKGIINGQFEINPKIILHKTDSCKFCKNKDICNKKFEDYSFLLQKDFMED